MSSTENDTAAKVDSKLVRTLVGKLEDVILPGDDPFAKGQLEEAARFILATACRRKQGEPVVALQSALGGRRILRIALINDDMPFLVDSVAATIAAHGLSIDRLVHPVLRVERDSDNMLAGFPGKGAPVPAESMIYLETERVDARLRTGGGAARGGAARGGAGKGGGHVAPGNAVGTARGRARWAEVSARVRSSIVQ